MGEVVAEQGLSARRIVGMADEHSVAERLGEFAVESVIANGGQVGVGRSDADEAVVGVPGVGRQSCIGIGEQDAVAGGIEGVGEGLADGIGDALNCLPARS